MMDTRASNQSRICRLGEAMPPRWVLLVLLCGVLLFRGYVVVALADSLAQDPDGYKAVAHGLAAEHTFAVRRMGGSSIPTASRPPLYPIVSLPLDWMDANDAYGYGALHVVLGALTVACVWHLGRLWKLPPGACLVAAALVTVDPVLLAQSAQVMTETLAALLAAASLIAVTCFARESSIPWALAAGVSAGLCVLCRPEFLVWLVAVPIVFSWCAAGPRRARRIAVYLAAAAAVVAPWGIRNFHVFGRPIITTTHGGFTLLLANNPDFYEYLRGAPWGSAWDGESIYKPWRERELGSLKKTPAGPIINEVANDRWAYREAFTNIRAEPAIFAWSCLARVGRLWNVLPHQTSADESPVRRGMRWAVAIWYAFNFALAAAGAWFLRGKLFAAPWLWGTLLALSITAVHAFYWTDMRMRAPLAGTVALASAYGLAVLACGKPDASRFPGDA